MSIPMPTDKLRLHDLEEVPFIPRQYLLVRSVADGLQLKSADYDDIKHWLGSVLTHNKWMTVTDRIAASCEAGEYVRFDIDGSAVVVFTQYTLEDA